MNNAPYSIVEYNKFRINSLSADIADRELLCIDIPAALRPQVVGAISLLLDPNLWRDYDGVTSIDMYELCNNEIKFVDICDIVRDCVLNDAGVQGAIQSVSGNGFGPQTVINNTQYTNIQIISQDADINGCGNDSKFGRIISLVSYIDTVMSDFFESIDAASNIIDQFSNLVSAIPVIGLLPFDEFAQVVGNTGEFWRDSYDASVNTQLLEDFQCQLWCAYSSECSITVGDVRELLLERYNLSSTQGTLNVLSAAALIARIALTIASGGVGTYIGDDFVYLSWLLQLTAIEATGQFFGVDPVDYVSAAANGTPNNAWSLCDCPNAWLYEVDFTEELGKFAVKSGTWVAGTGIVSNVALGSEASWFEQDVPVIPAATVTSIVVTYTITSKCESSSRWSVVHVANYQNPVRTLSSLNIGTTTEECFTDGNTVSIRIRNTSQGSCSNVVISYVKVAGTGANPFA